ncbi:hypothetical protein L915_08311 [Phytophthora nicotianae]|uniref:Uncharacterized protein n=2 Tax=Phytophthora nicotianae TaxID=4792 RepID=V9F6X6_PHYNI|nr:hypothetical protein F443_08480 [Phytophthora nicotianae P1569]ETK87212.1 hypothetical protein L915_08311 [Phytophthora nicotianae]
MGHMSWSSSAHSSPREIIDTQLGGEGGGQMQLTDMAHVTIGMASGSQNEPVD